MNLKINFWYGRLGNNIFQVINCIQIASFYNYNIIIPSHKYLTKQYITINKSIMNSNNNIYTDDVGEQFYFIKENDSIFEKVVFEKNIDFTISILQEIFSIKNVPILHENTVVIHIRGGDIFRWPHGDYIMPPLSYYTNIINSNHFKKLL